MLRSTPLRLIAAGATVLAVAFGASAPTGASAASAVPAGATISAAASDADCPELDDDPDELQGALVVLVDGSASSDGEVDRVAAIAELVDRTTSDRTVAVSIGSFGGSDAEVRYDRCLDGDAFAPTGNNARTRERNRDDLVDGLGERLAALPGSYTTTDPTSALRAGFARLSQASSDGPRVLVIHTDGIPTAGCAALGDEVAIDDPGLIDRLVASCQDAGQLPVIDSSSETPVEVVIGGIGRTADDLGADAVTFLLTLNTALCEATGAVCHIDPNLPTDAWPADA